MTTYYCNPNMADQGAARSVDNFTCGPESCAEIVNWIGTTNAATIVFSGKNAAVTTYLFSTSETIPDNIVIKIESGAHIKDDTANASLTINGFIDAGSYQIFDWGNGSGSITYAKKARAAWFGDATTDIGACIQTAINSGVLEIELPAGSNIPMTTGVSSTTDNIRVFGAGIRSTKIVMGADVLPFAVIGDWWELEGFWLYNSGTHTKNGIEIGNSGKTEAGDRTVLRDIAVEGMGGDGVAGMFGSLVTVDNLYSVLNGGNGINLSGTTGVNAWHFSGSSDLRGNTGAGIAIVSGSGNHSGGLLVCQSNGTYGLDIDGQAMTLEAYTENNTTGGFILDSNSTGNRIFLTNLQSGGTPATNNGVGNYWSSNKGAGNRRIVQGDFIIHSDNGISFREGASAGNLNIVQEGINQWKVNLTDFSADGAILALNDSANKFVDLVLEGRASELWSPQALSTAGNATYTTDQVRYGLLLRDPNGDNRSDVTPTAADLVTEMPGIIASQGFEFIVRNTAGAAETITVTAGTGCTLSGTMTIDQNYTRRFLIVFTNVTASSEAYTLYSLGTYLH